LIQKYLENPYLYKKRKFDVRVMLVVDYKGQIFISKLGFARVSGPEYDLSKFGDPFIHLTNIAI
jgi:hypothetical protein